MSRLVGAPPGYVGYDEGGQLTEAVRRKPYSVVLLDEIEKAHPDTFNVLLQVLDDGRLTDNKGRTVNFKNTIIIMTSNMGSHIIHDNFEKLDDDNAAKIFEQTKHGVLELLKKSLRPEFLNRIDETIMFKPLDRSEILGIVKIQLEVLKAKLQTQGVTLDFSPEALEYIANIGFDPQFGARPIKRALQKEVLNELSKEIISGKVHAESIILVDSFNDDIVFRNVEEEAKI